MIFGNIKQLDNYSSLSEGIKECFEYAKQHSLLDYKTGTYQLRGENIFVNIVEYETCNKDDRFWEAHRKYIDIHLMLEGSERIDVNFIDELEQKEYKAEDDFLALAGDNSGSVKLKDGDFLICFPEDAHMTAIKTEEKEEIKKAIFKVIVE